MWLSRVCLISLFALTLSACGFRPLYGDYSGAKVMPALETIFVEVIEDRGGQILRNELLTLISPKGMPNPTKYRLKIDLNEMETTQLQRTDETATRTDLRLVSKFVLVRVADNETVLSGGSISIGSYDLVDAEFGRITAKKNARRRASREMAQDIRSRLSTFFLNPPRKNISTH
jgi:LPS-assembly lipoprotein